jgi:hypothetical protein
MHCITDPLEQASSQARHHNVTPAHWLPRYAFNCTFNGGHGLAWVDGHLLCNHGMPLYAHNVGPGPIPLVGGHPVSVRLQFVKNTTDAADVAVEMMWVCSSATATLGAKSGDEGQRTIAATQQRSHDQQAFAPLPGSQLLSAYPSAAETHMADLQREQYNTTAGWGSWYPHNLLAVTRLPDGAQVKFGLCQVCCNSCRRVFFNSAPPP